MRSGFKSKGRVGRWVIAFAAVLCGLALACGGSGDYDEGSGHDHDNDHDHDHDHGRGDDGGGRGPPATYSIGGTVAGMAGAGLILRDNGSDDLAVTHNGAFT